MRNGKIIMHWQGMVQHVVKHLTFGSLTRVITAATFKPITDEDAEQRTIFKPIDDEDTEQRRAKP